MLSDNESGNNIVACGLIHRLLDVAPASVISRTGFYIPFHDALTSCISSSFNLATTVHDDLNIGFHAVMRLDHGTVETLNAVYPALIRLEITLSMPNTTAKLSRILCGYLIPSLNTLNIKRNHGVAICLLSHIRHIIEDLSINTVEHLAALVPLFRKIMSDQEASQSPQLLSAVCITLKSLILSAHRRILAWREDLLSGVIAARKYSLQSLDAIADAYDVTDPIVTVIYQCRMLVIKLHDTVHTYVPADGEAFDRNTFDTELLRLAQSDRELTWLLPPSLAESIHL